VLSRAEGAANYYSSPDQEKATLQSGAWLNSRGPQEYNRYPIERAPTKRELERNEELVEGLKRFFCFCMRLPPTQKGILSLEGQVGRKEYHTSGS